MVVLVVLPCWAQGTPGKPHQSPLHCCKLLRNRCGDNPHSAHISLLLSPVIRNRLSNAISEKGYDWKEKKVRALMRNTPKAQMSVRSEAPTEQDTVLCGTAFRSEELIASRHSKSNKKTDHAHTGQVCKNSPDRIGIHS